MSFLQAFEVEITTIILNHFYYKPTGDIFNARFNKTPKPSLSIGQK
jgi:hypothetical protein